ncbi:hypothetical protein [[Hallella] seregens]|uniref:Uncharacterized protein n=1 Tax=Hallella seregens ATCC 51272 TaxID=1336250 RepID=A0ABV5ZNT5_9BACT|nr:hypothetical protein [Hallella seregens]
MDYILSQHGARNNASFTLPDFANLPAACRGGGAMAVQTPRDNGVNATRSRRKRGAMTAQTRGENGASQAA